MTKVFLREKPIKGNRLSLYLDYYPPIPHPATGKATRREFLRLYIHEKPKTQTERDHNKEIQMLAEQIHAVRVLAVARKDFGFLAEQDANKNFIEHAETFVEKKQKRSTYRQWISMLNHLKAFTGQSRTFAQIDAAFCESFRDHLMYDADLKRNSASQLNNLFRSLVKKSADKLKVDPLVNVKGIGKKRSQRNYLELIELKAMAAAECPIYVLKKAGLFSALTGLRFSDLQKLKWKEVRTGLSGHYIQFDQQKTDEAEHLPISDEAFALLEERDMDDALVFEGLQRWYCQLHLPTWLANAGITKHFTFHCFRHTYSVLQLSEGTDLYTLMKMLGHSDIKTTQIYAQIVDQKKREATGRISLK